MRKNNRIKFRIWLLFAVIPITAALHATTLARLSIDQLAAAADDVARVRFSNTESRWENGSIWTATTFDVIETMKGDLPAQVTIRLPGGRVGHITATVDGVPKFDAICGDAILFLERSSSGAFSVAGWVQGTFRIVRDPRSHRETVTQDSSAFAVFDPTTHSFRAEGIRQMPIEEFHSRIAMALSRAQEKIR